MVEQPQFQAAYSGSGVQSLFQILQLLLLQDKLTAHQFQRVATSTIVAMARQHPEQAEKHLLRPLLEPLLRCLAVTSNALLLLRCLNKASGRRAGEQELRPCPARSSGRFTVPVLCSVVLGYVISTGTNSFFATQADSE